MSLSIAVALALLLASTSAAGVISASSSKRSAHFSALGVSLVAAVMALVVAGVDLGGRLGRDAAERDNRSAVTESL